MVTDRWAPGWRLPSMAGHGDLGAHFIFRAVEICAGCNQVTFELARGHSVFLSISWSTLFLFAAGEVRRKVVPVTARRTGYRRR